MTGYWFIFLAQNHKIPSNHSNLIETSISHMAKAEIIAVLEVPHGKIIRVEELEVLP
jgi:hypothetical protein